MGKEWSDDLNFFDKFNWRVMAIGEWFGEQRENASNAVMLIAAVLGILFFILTVVGTWINEGFFWALIGGAILGVIYYYVGLIALGLLMIVTRIVFTVLRYVFYNVYTLIAAIIIFILI